MNHRITTLKFRARYPRPASCLSRSSGTYTSPAQRHTHVTPEEANGVVAFPSRPQIKKPGSHALARLPLSSIFRSLVLGSFFTSSLLHRPGLSVLKKIAESRSALLNPDRNPIIRAVVKSLIYDHFCAGTNKSEIRHSISQFKNIGYSGVILCYGKEFDVRKQAGKLPNELGSAQMDEELEHWYKGNLETLDMLSEGDVLGMKITGAGKSITDAMIAGADPPKQFAEAMETICRVASMQKNRIFIDAEQQAFQHTIDRWTIDLMRRYNRNGEVLVYTTIQAYLKEARQKLVHQLKLAETEGWTLAFKLVRGAYIAYDPRHLIHDTKVETDECYDGIVEDLMSGNLPGVSKANFPEIKLFLAGHNPESVAKASELVRKLGEQDALKTVPEFGQLQGMADTLGCQIIQQAEDMKEEKETPTQPVATPQVYKWSTWGSLQDCMQYLVRRAIENRGAAERMRDGMGELSGELKRRMVDWAMGRRRLPRDE